jgi:hypothetical protein
MNETITTREWPVRFKARWAGVFYLLSVFSAVLAEAFIHGRILYAAGLLPVISFAIATLLLYGIFKPVSRTVSLLAVILNLAGLAIEALELHFGPVNGALIFHGLYCLLIAYLVIRSRFLPRILGALMAIGGLSWLTILLPDIAGTLHGLIQAAGFVGEGALMLWLLTMGVDGAKWDEQTIASE